MKSVKTSFDEAIKIYTEHYNKIPEYGKIIDLYHNYLNNWKKYSNFLEWLINTID